MGECVCVCVFSESFVGCRFKPSAEDEVGAAAKCCNKGTVKQSLVRGGGRGNAPELTLCLAAAKVN